MQNQSWAMVPLNGYDPSVNGHNKYEGERFIEPYRWGNYQEKEVKQWYKDTMQSQRKRTKTDYPTFYNINSIRELRF